MLSQTAEYALRAMAWIATNGDGQIVRAHDLSDAVDVPAHYLAKILRRLVVAELLVSHKGPGGGFGLARPPAEIRFLAPIRSRVFSRTVATIWRTGAGPAWRVVDDGVE